MPQAYSQDLRQRILKDYDAGVPIEDLVQQYAISRSSVYSYIKQRRETGNFAPKNYKRGPKLKLAPYEKEVRRLVADQPDATLEELHARLPNKDDVTVVTLHNFLHRLKITWKKRLSAPPNDTEKMLPKSEKNGSSCKKFSTSKNSFSSTKLGRKRT
jgi:transposase